MALFPSICGVKSDDVVYICLPLYHSAGFAIGFSGAIERGMHFNYFDFVLVIQNVCFVFVHVLL